MPCREQHGCEIVSVAGLGQFAQDPGEGSSLSLQYFNQCATKQLAMRRRLCRQIRDQAADAPIMFVERVFDGIEIGVDAACWR